MRRDLLVVVPLATAVHRALAAESESVTGALIAVGTIVAWSVVLAWIGDRFPSLRSILRAPPVAVVENGQLLRRSMRREFITEDELMAQLRLQGIDDISGVKRAYLESDGRISVIADEPRPQRSRERAAG